MKPTSTEVDLSLVVKRFATGWQKALLRAPKVELIELAWRPRRPGKISVDLHGIRPRVKSFFFGSPPPSIGIEPNRQATSPPAAAGFRPAAEKRTTTRIKPPGDIVKLDDRLHYVLQPPLESLLGNGTLDLPHQPFPFQFQGIAFLYPRYAAVLADEMGLGKTMQAVTAVRLLLHSGSLRRVLFVCPKPLVSNWVREFRQWAEEIPVSVVEGNTARRRWLWSNVESIVQIANYELVHRDRELLEQTGLSYDLVVLDEAQRIKNRSSATSQAVRSIRRRRSWALTGTPIENSTDDLAGIFEYVSPGLVSPGMKPRHLARQIRDYVLRRTKDQVLEDLPPKLIRDAELPLSGEQHATYRQAEDDGIVRLSGMGEAISIQHVFELILRLKQICNFDPVTGESAKLNSLTADLEEVAASGKKAIVFSQWVDTLKRLGERLRRFKPLEYHGGIAPLRRDEIIEQFRREPDRHVMLISYGAGGVGINLQFCEYVFLFDRWWNPAVEDQAINRAHRIGTARPVTVTRYISIGTIEERINQILEEKRELFDAIFASGNEGPKNLGLTQDEIFGLFDLKVSKSSQAA